jgi:hypothetical protein
VSRKKVKNDLVKEQLTGRTKLKCQVPSKLVLDKTLITPDKIQLVPQLVVNHL